MMLVSAVQKLFLSMCHKMISLFFLAAYYKFHIHHSKMFVYKLNKSSRYIHAYGVLCNYCIHTQAAF